MSRSEYPNRNKMQKVADDIAAARINDEAHLANELQAADSALSRTDALKEAKRIQEKNGPGWSLTPSRAAPNNQSAPDDLAP